MKAVITAEFSDEAEQRLLNLGFTTHRAGWGVTGQPLHENELVDLVGQAAVLITEHDPVSRALIESCPQLGLVVSCRGTPVGIDTEAAAENGVTVMNTPGRNADAVADFTIGCILDAVRHISASDRHHRRSGWTVSEQMPYLHFRGRELSKLTLGIVGLGAIGQKVAKRALHGFEMKVLATTRSPVGFEGVEEVGLDTLLSRADVVSLHCPHTDETHHLIDGRALSKMKRGSCLINVARGAIVETDALLHSLQTGHLSAAVLDVYDPEPPARTSELFATPGLTLTPHIAGASQDVIDHHSSMAVDCVERWLAGRQTLAGAEATSPSTTSGGLSPE